MEPTPGPPRRDSNSAWLPLTIIVALIVLLILSAWIVFRDEGEADPIGSLPASFAPATTPATAAPPATTAPPAGGDEPTTAAGRPDASAALAQYVEDNAVTLVSDIVPIGSNEYALAVVDGFGRLLRWDRDEWQLDSRLSTPTAIDAVHVADVTRDGTDDFVIGLSGLHSPGGVYSRATFQFAFLPFNTTNGQEDFVDGLSLQFGRLQSPYVDTGGTRTLVWAWTGRMFETS
jgi:hypothetical protein